MVFCAVNPFLTHSNEEESRYQAATVALLRATGRSTDCSLERLQGGGNNRVFRVTAGEGVTYLLKAYFHAPSDTRNRFEHEHAFYRLLQSAGIREVPESIGWDAGERLGLFEYVPHAKLKPEEVLSHHVMECARFFVRINAARHSEAARCIPRASEACFSLNEHVDIIEKRVQRLGALVSDPGLPEAVAAFVQGRLLPAWTPIRESIRACNAGGEVLPAEFRCLSPSDFGFHNVLVTQRGLLFLDFEYAGWDDPAKMACDFFCQPDIPAPRKHWEDFLRETCLPECSLETYETRVRTLLPAYHIKWACIILNVFLKDASRRRAFADSRLLTTGACEAQLAKAHAQLEALVDLRSG
jgi:hypothetical protein